MNIIYKYMEETKNNDDILKKLFGELFKYEKL